MIQFGFSEVHMEGKSGKQSAEAGWGPAQGGPGKAVCRRDSGVSEAFKEQSDGHRLIRETCVPICSVVRWLCDLFKVVTSTSLSLDFFHLANRDYNCTYSL